MGGMSSTKTVDAYCVLPNDIPGRAPHMLRLRLSDGTHVYSWHRTKRDALGTGERMLTAEVGS